MLRSDEIEDLDTNLEVILRMLMKKGIMTEKEFKKEFEAYVKELDEEAEASRKAAEPSEEAKRFIEAEARRPPTGLASSYQRHSLKSAIEHEEWDNGQIQDLVKKYEKRKNRKK